MSQQQQQQQSQDQLFRTFSQKNNSKLNRMSTVENSVGFFDQDDNNNGDDGQFDRADMSSKQSGNSPPIKLKKTSTLFDNQTQNRRASVSSTQSLSMSIGELSKFSILPQDIIEISGLPDYFDPSTVGHHELKQCEICEQVFNMTVRRHHCRRCGKSVCNKCSSNQKPLSKADQQAKTLHRICDACDCEIENFKLRKNHDEILLTQSDLIEVLKVSIETADHRKSLLKVDYERQKVKLHEELEKKIKKKEDMEQTVLGLRRELERLNNMRNTLYAEIGSEERVLKEKEQEKNRLIVQKSAKLQDLAEKEKMLHEKEIKNEDLKKLVEAQRQKVQKVQQAAMNNSNSLQQQPQTSYLEEEKKTNKFVVPLLDNDQGKEMPIQTEEQKRLDQMRSDKFKFIMDAMASHAIEEHNSEYSASFISMDNGGRIARISSNAYQIANNNTVLEVDEASESSQNNISMNQIETRSRHQIMHDRMMKLDNNLDGNGGGEGSSLDEGNDPQDFHLDDQASEESFQKPQIMRKPLK